MTEHTSSYYAASANKYAPFDTLNESISCDVCVVGGGYIFQQRAELMIG